MTKAKKQIASVDAGNGGVDTIFNGKPSYIPSVRAAASGDSLGLGAEFEMQYDYADWNNHRYIFGDDVLRVSRRALERHLGSNRYGNEFHQFLVATALAKAGVLSGEVDLTLFAPPGLYSAVKADMVNAFKDVTIRLRNDKKPREWTYSSVTVWPEGLAMIGALILNDKGEVVDSDLLSGDVLILDIGVHTLDAVLLQNGDFNPEALVSATWEGAGADVHIRQPVLKALRRQSDDFAHATVDDIDKLLRDEAGSVINMGGASADLTAVLEQHTLRHAEWIANTVIDGRFDGLRGIRKCIIGGGIGPREEKYFMQWYGEKIFKRSTNVLASRSHPGYWNAWGGYKLALAAKAGQS